MSNVNNFVNKRNYLKATRRLKKNSTSSAGDILSSVGPIDDGIKTLKELKLKSMVQADRKVIQALAKRYKTSEAGAMDIISGVAHFSDRNTKIFSMMLHNEPIKLADDDSSDDSDKGSSNQ